MSAQAAVSDAIQTGRKMFQNVSASSRNFASKIEQSKFVTQRDWRKDIVTKSLFVTKIMLLSTFAIMSFIYMVAFSETSPTMFQQGGDSAMRATFDGLFGGFMAGAAAASVLYMRGGMEHVKHSWWHIGLIFAIVSGFGLAQEGSGLNRWLAAGQKPYRPGPDTGSPEGMFGTKQKNSAVPFNDTLALFSMGLMAVLFMVVAGMMFVGAAIGFKEGMSNAADIQYAHKVQSVPNHVWFWVVEVVLVMGVMNAIPAIVSPAIRGETYTGDWWRTSAVMCLVAISVQVILQYSGVYDVPQTQRMRME